MLTNKKYIFLNVYSLYTLYHKQYCKIKKNYTKTRLSPKLELLGIELDRFEIYKTENGKMIVKDFELIALSVILEIPFEEIKKLIEI